MNYIFIIDGHVYFLGFESLYDPDYRYIRMTETQGDITFMPVNEKDDDPNSGFFCDISDSSFKEDLIQIFNRCDYEFLAFIEMDGIYYSKLTHTIDFFDAIKFCCDFREENEIVVRVI